MVSAAKLRRAQGRMTEARPYAGKMAEVLAGLVRGVDRESHPLLAMREPENSLVIVVTGDRGLCSSFNSNALKKAEKLINELKQSGSNVTVTPVGRKAKSFLKHVPVEKKEGWEGLSGKANYASGAEIAKSAIDQYRDEAVDEVHIVYNEFKSVMIQQVVSKRLLPIETDGLEGADQTVDFMFEPSANAILGRLLPKYVEVQVYQALLESQAAEEAARMNAMENATQAATDMIGSLTLQFNKARQASITAELMDIIGGAEAVKQ